MTLREARKRKGLTQKELAEIVGISSITLSLIENYKAFPRAETRGKLRTFSAAIRLAQRIRY